MRPLILSLLCACAACGSGGGCPAETVTIRHCGYFDTQGRFVPGFTVTSACDADAVEDYGLATHDDTEVEDWITAWSASVNAVQDCDPADDEVPDADGLLGLEVLDYRTGAFVLLATEAEVDAFLNR